MALSITRTNNLKFLTSEFAGLLFILILQGTFGLQK